MVGEAERPSMLAVLCVGIPGKDQREEVERRFWKSKRPVDTGFCLSLPRFTTARIIPTANPSCRHKNNSSKMSANNGMKSDLKKLMPFQAAYPKR